MNTKLQYRHKVLSKNTKYISQTTRESRVVIVLASLQKYALHYVLIGQRSDFGTVCFLKFITIDTYIRYIISINSSKRKHMVFIFISSSEWSKIVILGISFHILHLLIIFFNLNIYLKVYSSLQI